MYVSIETEGCRRAFLGTITPDTILTTQLFLIRTRRPDNHIGPTDVR